MTSVNGATGRDAHRTETEPDCCPLCGTPISAATRARLDEKLRTQLAKTEQTLRDQFAREQRQAAAKAAAQVAKAKADAAAQVERVRKDATKAAATALQPKIAEAVAQAVQAERTKAYGEKLSLEQQLEEMKRRLQRRSAHDIGEPAEIDLHAALAAALPKDRVSRVAKGVRGPDVVVEIIYEGSIAGKITLDSKDHLRWLNKFTIKLREDQIAEGADFSILSSSAFPVGARELYIQDNVIVASPARVLVLVHLLRRNIIENYRLKLSAEARNEKGAKLLAYIGSAAYGDLFERVAKLTADLLDIGSPTRLGRTRPETRGLA